MEIWKDIKDYEGHYQVSDLGRVKTVKFTKERILKPGYDRDGYQSVCLFKNNKGKKKHIHQLVAIAFLNHKPCGQKRVVDHIDNVKVNNALQNLQIISQRENASKDKSGYTCKYVGVYKHQSYEKWVASININGKSNYLGYYDTPEEASAVYQNRLTAIQTNS